MQYTRRVLAGLATYLPGVGRLAVRSTGGTSSARYCYLVWLRHLVLAGRSGLSTSPRVVAELGPGDSLGTGLAALLSGASRYYAFDVLEYANVERNLAILDELIQLFRDRSPLPDGEFELKPSPVAREFPYTIVTDNRLEEALTPSRLQAIRRALTHPGEEQGGVLVAYEPHWADTRAEPSDRVDFMFSQAVLEHIDDLETTYRAMARWLGDTGHVSHEIDFRSHDFAREWNGHWTYSDLEWRLIRGRRPYAINRAPLSTHLALLDRAGFKIVDMLKRREESSLTVDDLALRFRSLSTDDLTTAGAFLQAIRRPHTQDHHLNTDG